MANLKQQYTDVIRAKLKEELGLANIMMVPKLEKITLNMGLGEAVNDKKIIEHATHDMVLISGQRPIVTKTRKSIAGFKIRDGWPIGLKVTLRDERMYDFMERLVHVAFPRVRDFRGMSIKKFDGRGNYNFGLTEQIVFPEIDYDKIDKLRGMNITITTSALNDEMGVALLRAFGFPFNDLKKRG